MAGLGAIIALALVLFPDWNGVHPGDDLTTPLGHAWFLSAPPPPEHFDGLRVERDWTENIWIAIGILIVGICSLVLGPRKAQQK
jgi:hypothetical protein